MEAAGSFVFRIDSKLRVRFVMQRFGKPETILILKRTLKLFSYETFYKGIFFIDIYFSLLS